MTRESDIAALVETTVRRFGGLHCYVGNAGDTGAHGSIAEIDEIGFDRTVAVLLKGVAFGMKHACGAIRDTGGGSVISTSSSAALMGGLAPHLYSMCRGPSWD